MHRYDRYDTTLSWKSYGSLACNIRVHYSVALLKYTRATVIALGAIGLVTSVLLVAKLPTLHRFGTTAGWVCMPLSYLLLTFALPLRINPSIQSLLINEDVDALFELLSANMDLEDLVLWKILNIAAEKDSTKLAEKVLSRAAEPSPDMATVVGKPLCAVALDNAIKCRNLSVLSYLLSEIARRRETEMYSGTLVSVVQKAFEKRDRELAALLAQKLDFPARAKLFCFVCNRMQNEEVYLQIAKDLISVEALAENASTYFEELKQVYERCAFGASWTLIEYLLESGAPPLNAGICDWPTEMLERYFEKLCERGVLHSPSLVCPYYQLLENLLEYAATHNYLSQPDNKGDTPLHLAVSRLDRSCVKAFIKAGADIGARNCAGTTPFEEAIDSENKNLLLDFILPLSDATVQDGIKLAIERGKEKTGIFLLRSGREFAFSELLALSLQKGMADLSTCLSFKLNGAKIDDEIVESAQKGGLDTFFSSLFYQKDGKRFAETFTSAASRGNATALRQAFGVGIGPLSQGISSYDTFLRMAITYGHPAVIALILSFCTHMRDRALIWACTENTSRTEEIVEMLLRNGADPQVYHYSAGEIVETHLRKVANPQRHTKAPIHWAIKSGHVRAIQALCKHHPPSLSLRTPDKSPLTPLGLSVQLHKPDALRELIACGADVNQVDEKGGTLLHTIARYQSYKSFEEKAFFLDLLIQAGTSTFALNADHLCFSDYLNDEELKAYNKHYPCKRTACSIITGLPLEIIRGISENLSAKDLANMSLVSKEWYASVAPILDSFRIAWEITSVPLLTEALSPVLVDTPEVASTVALAKESILSEKLLEMASSKFSFDAQIGKERKVRYICALIEAGADPKFLGSEHTYFWQMLSVEELGECKEAFGKRSWEESVKMMVPSSFPNDFLSKLPTGVGELIFERLPIGSFKVARFVCKKWHQISKPVLYSHLAHQFLRENYDLPLHRAAQAPLPFREDEKREVLTRIFNAYPQFLKQNFAQKYFWDYLEGSERLYWKEQCQKRLEAIQ